MNEYIQILLFIAISALTVIFVLIGWEVFKIFSEIRKMMVKFNFMIDKASDMTNSLGKSLKNISGFSEGLKAVLNIFALFNKKKETQNE